MPTNIPAHTPHIIIPNFLILDTKNAAIKEIKKIMKIMKLTHNEELSLCIKNTSPAIRPTINVVINPITKTVIPNIFSPTNNSIGPMETPKKKNINLNLEINEKTSLFNSRGQMSYVLI